MFENDFCSGLGCVLWKWFVSRVGGEKPIAQICFAFVLIWFAGWVEKIFYYWCYFCFADLVNVKFISYYKIRAVSKPNRNSLNKVEFRSRRFACTTPGGIPKHSWPLLSLTFALLLSLSFSLSLSLSLSHLSIQSPLRLLLLAHFRESPEAKILLSPIVWHN